MLREVVMSVYLTHITPFTKTLELDLEGLSNVIKAAEERGIRKFVPLGTAGEFASLSSRERVNVVETVRSSLNKGEVIAGASSTSFSEVWDLCKAYRDLGVERIMLVPPYYFRGNDGGIMEFFRQIESRCEMGMVIYNNPQVVGIDLSPEFVEELVRQVPSVKALKDARNSVVELREVVRRVGERIEVIDGLEERALLGLMLGAKGFTTSLGSFAPSLPLGIYNAFQAGDIRSASSLYDLLLEYRATIRPPLTMVHPSKLGAWMRGLIKSYAVRPPLPQLDSVPKERLEAIKGIVGKIIDNY